METLDESIGKLGFGLMRLPKVDGEIDIAQVSAMVDAFLDAGFNYFDTAWGYAGSEDAIRQALGERYPRERFLLATKTAAWAGCKTAGDARAQFDTSLERTGAGYFDFYLLHNLGPERTHFFDDFAMWDFVQQKKAEGLVRHVGFSIHDSAEALEAVLDAHPEVEFVQLQVNYLDWESPMHQSRRCLEVARAHGKPVIVMEPLRGGLLANPPETVRQVLQPAEPGASCASWALRFAASQPGVLTVLSGMSDLAQMRDNIATMQGFAGMTPQQLAVIEQAQRTFEEFDLIPCTACEYCAKVCPANIGISGALLALNAHTLFGDYRTEWVVGGERRGKSKPSACLQCGTCEAACPQRIPIVECLEKAARDLDL